MKTAKLLAARRHGASIHNLIWCWRITTAQCRERTRNAGRVTAEMGLNPAEWKMFAAGANLCAAVFAETGLRTVFHHHCAGYVETPDEIAKLLELTDPQTIGLVFDTGHYVFGSGQCDALQGLERFQERVWYVHLKDCDPAVAQQSRAEKWDYFQSLARGVFCELGKGCVDFPAVSAVAGQAQVRRIFAGGTGRAAGNGRAKRKCAP